MSRRADRDPFTPKSVGVLIEETVAFCVARFRLQGVELRLPQVPAALSVECRPTEISQDIQILVEGERDLFVVPVCFQSGPSVPCRIF